LRQWLANPERWEKSSKAVLLCCKKQKLPDPAYSNHKRLGIDKSGAIALA
jgi:hypothetical protein